MTTMEALARVSATRPKGELLGRMAKRMRVLRDWLFPPLVSSQGRVAGRRDYLFIAPPCGEWIDPKLWDLLEEAEKAAEAKADKPEVES